MAAKQRASYRATYSPHPLPLPQGVNTEGIYYQTITGFKQDLSGVMRQPAVLEAQGQAHVLPTSSPSAVAAASGSSCSSTGAEPEAGKHGQAGSSQAEGQQQGPEEPSAASAGRAAPSAESGNGGGVGAAAGPGVAGGGLEAAAQVGAGEARASDESTGSEGSGSDDDSDSGSDSDGDSVGGPRDKSGLKDARKVSRPGQTYVLNSMNYLYIQYRGPGTGDLTGLVLRCLGPGLTVLVLGPG